jgi:hypothetical protein
MKTVKRAVLFVFGILAALLALGCSNPMASSPGEVVGSGLETAPETSTDLDTPFIVTFTIGQDGIARNVAGLDANRIYAGAEGIRNFVQLVAVDQNAKTIAGFAEDRKTTSSDTQFSLTLQHMTQNKTYAFLLLMGYWKWTEADGYDNTKPPTLLAAGLAKDQTLNGAGVVTVKIIMYPLVVDTKFQRVSDDLIIEPQKDQGKPQPAYIPPGTWKAIWTLQRAATGTDGFATALIPAQKIIDSGAGDALWIKNRKIILGGNPVSSGPGSTTTCFDYDIPPVNTGSGSGSVNFNLEYVPFNLAPEKWSGVESLYFTNLSATGGPVWIIRNGVNDEVPDGDTDFSNIGKAGSSANGNGAVQWVVGLPPQPSTPNTGNLTVDNGAFVGTTYTTNAPRISFTTGGYTSGTAEAWYAVVNASAAAPANTAYIWMESVTPGGPHRETISVTDDQKNNGYDVYVVISKDGQVSNPEIISTAGGTVIVVPEFGDDVVTDTDLSGTITMPVIGDTPNTNFIPPTTDQFTGGQVSWYNGSSPVSGPFADGIQYTAKVTLTAKTGFTFAAVGNFSYTGAISVTASDNNGSSITVAITFPPSIPATITLRIIRVTPPAQIDSLIQVILVEADTVFDDTVNNMGYTGLPWNTGMYNGGSDWVDTTNFTKMYPPSSSVTYYTVTENSNWNAGRENFWADVTIPMRPTGKGYFIFFVESDNHVRSYCNAPAKPTYDYRYPYNTEYLFYINPEYLYANRRLPMAEYMEINPATGHSYSEVIPISYDDINNLPSIMTSKGWGKRPDINYDPSIPLWYN